MKLNLHRSGYTLVELIIVITIILLFSGLLLPQYNNYIEQSKLKTGAQKLADVLSLAKKKTMAKDTINTCVNNFTGYQVMLDQNQYVLYYCCAGNCSFSTINTYKFVSPVNIHTIPGHSTPYPISFTTSIQGTSLTSAIDIYLQNTNIGSTNNCVHLNVTTNGIVSQDSQFTSC